MVQPRKIEKSPNMTKKDVDWDIKQQHNISHLLIIFCKVLDLHQDIQNFAPDLDPTV